MSWFQFTRISKKISSRNHREDHSWYEEIGFSRYGWGRHYRHWDKRRRHYHWLWRLYCIFDVWIKNADEMIVEQNFAFVHRSVILLSKADFICLDMNEFSEILPFNHTPYESMNTRYQLHDRQFVIYVDCFPTDSIALDEVLIEVQSLWFLIFVNWHSIESSVDTSQISHLDLIPLPELIQLCSLSHPPYSHWTGKRESFSKINQYSSYSFDLLFSFRNFQRHFLIPRFLVKRARPPLFSSNNRLT